MSTTSSKLRDVDSKTHAEASRRYFSLRRGYWRFFLGIVLFPVLYWAIAVIGLNDDPLVGGMLTFTPALGLLVCWLGMLVEWFRLIQFRCPRCGGRFVLSWLGVWLGSACQHCDLELGLALGRRTM